MKIQSDNFVEVPFNISENNDNGIANESCQDPFHGVAVDNQETILIRQNKIVFAEPISTYSKENDNDLNDETILINNVTVQKRKGKRNKYHILFEDASNPKCPQASCKKSFSTVTLLKAHIRKVHFKQLSHMCTQCGEMFPQKYLLERHCGRHGEKVCCSVCDKTLSKTSLHQHMKSHGSTRPHECRVCNKRFLRKSVLNNHVRFVHKESELKCDGCDERFTTRIKWTRHKMLCRKTKQ